VLGIRGEHLERTGKEELTFFDEGAEPEIDYSERNAGFYAHGGLRFERFALKKWFGLARFRNRCCLGGMFWGAPHRWLTGDYSEQMNIFAANDLMKSLMQRPQPKLQERFVDALDTCTVQSVTKCVPWLFDRGAQLPPVQKNDVLVAS
jgi:hypothetical protein